MGSPKQKVESSGVGGALPSGNRMVLVLEGDNHDLEQPRGQNLGCR